ncbi:MAG: DNA-binding response regulator, partial [Campylobacterota bacterium]|nr:DNA-binding response regulator [Campylobacterota bacterium]
MNILIIDEEIYLAQKVTLKLEEEGEYCTHITNIKELNFNTKYDVILLSTNISSIDVEKIIKHYSSSIIILLVSYVNDATVSKPLKDGAIDYIVKPFIMDELVRKVYHYKEFKILKDEKNKLLNYLDFSFNNIKYNEKIPTKLPFIIESSNQRVSDKIVFDIAKSLNKEIKFISLEKNTKLNPSDFKDELLYIYDFNFIKRSSQDVILNLIENSNVIISTSERLEYDTPYEKLLIDIDNKKIDTIDSILTINDYVKMMVINFQNKFPDTEL